MFMCLTNPSLSPLIETVGKYRFEFQTDKIVLMDQIKFVGRQLESHCGVVVRVSRKT